LTARAAAGLASLALVSLGAAITATPAVAGTAQTVLVDDAFSGAATPPGTPVVALDGACLTADGNTTDTPIPGCSSPADDTDGQGVLQLTPAAFGAKGGVLYSSPLPFADGLDVHFTQYQYGSGYPADGIGFVISSAPPVPSGLGVAGGGLGYLDLQGGYLGIGLDVFGNYLDPLSGGTGCVQPAWATAENTGYGYHPNTVTVRGPGDSATGAGYCLLTSNLDPTYGLGEDLTAANGGYKLQGTSTANAGDRAASARLVHIVIDAVNKTYTVSIDFTGTGNSYTTVIDAAPLPSPLPSRITFGFASSTGGADDIHDISDVKITTFNHPAPSLSLTAADSGHGVLALGATGSFTLTAGVQTSSPSPETQAVSISDALPAGLSLAGRPSGSGWDCSATTVSMVSCTAAPRGAGLAPGHTLPPLTVPFKVTATSPGVATNTASAVSSDAVAAVSASDITKLVKRTGYWLAGADGKVFGYGPGVTLFGSAAGTRMSAPVVGIAASPARNGYWLAGADGGVFGYGPGAPFYGSAGGVHLAAKVVGVAAVPSGGGYWLVAADGGVFGYGPGAHFFGSASGLHLSAPIVAIAPVPSGDGYWLVAADGGVFGYGPGAHFFGSAFRLHLSAPIVGVASVPSGNGYWLVAADGGVFGYGQGAIFYGSTGRLRLAAPVTGIAAAPSGDGYWLAAADGGVFGFGRGSRFLGSAAGGRLGAPIRAITGG
jgi:hypothetical protein